MNNAAHTATIHFDIEAKVYLMEMSWADEEVEIEPAQLGTDLKALYAEGVEVIFS